MGQTDTHSQKEEQHCDGEQSGIPTLVSASKQAEQRPLFVSLCLPLCVKRRNKEVELQSISWPCCCCCCVARVALATHIKLTCSRDFSCIFRFPQPQSQVLSSASNCEIVGSKVWILDSHCSVPCLPFICLSRPLCLLKLLQLAANPIPTAQLVCDPFAPSASPVAL